MRATTTATAALHEGWVCTCNIYRPSAEHRQGSFHVLNRNNFIAGRRLKLSQLVASIQVVDRSNPSGHAKILSINQILRVNSTN